MNTTDVKNQMMKLWKDIFHDSDDYISLIFDNYFDTDLIEYEVVDNKIVASLIAVPYCFGLKNVDEKDKLRGLYLCGLATKPEYRKRGIMSKLIERINAKAETLNYDFTFLIPASNELADYYRYRDYVNGIYRVEENYLTIHDFKNECLSNFKNEIGDKSSCIADENIDIKNGKILYNAWKYLDSIQVKTYDIVDDEAKELIKKFLMKYELDCPYLIINHSIKDVDILIKENQISGGEIYAAFDDSQSVIAVGVVVTTEEEVEVRGMYYDNMASRAALLDSIASSIKDEHGSFRVFEAPGNVHREILWMPYTVTGQFAQSMLPGKIRDVGSTYNVADHPQVYAMVRVVNPCHILEFMGRQSDETKKSILVENLQNNNIAFTTANGLKYIVCDGKRELNAIKTDDSVANGVAKITRKELAEILFRPKNGSELVSEALDIPAMPLYATLLLD